MFTSLFQLEQKPVTVFSSDDTGAPVLTKDPGSLKTLLKACLVTGYGDKTALGWQMLFESTDTLSAAFASADPTASKFVLKINNSGATTAKLSAYQSMTDINTGVKPMAVDTEIATEAGAWRLIGHGKAFILLRDKTYNSGTVALPILFGDLPTETKRAAPAVVFWTSKFLYHVGGMQSVLFANVNGETGSSGSNTVTNANSYPFVINDGAGSINLTSNFCKFRLNQSALAAVMYEPVISALPDSTWTLIPMLQPLSIALPDVGNLGAINPNAIKARTGDDHNYGANADCAVPTDWWWA